MKKIKAWAVLERDPYDDYKLMDQLAQVVTAQYQIFSTYKEACSVSACGPKGVIRVEITPLPKEKK